MSTKNSNPAKESEKDSRTDAEKKADDKVDKAFEFLERAIEDRSKTVEIEPEYVFAIRVADEVKILWKNGKIPTVNDGKDACSSLGAPSTEISSSIALNLAVKATIVGYIYDLADKHKSTIEKFAVGDYLPTALDLQSTTLEVSD